LISQDARMFASIFGEDTELPCPPRANFILRYHAEVVALNGASSLDP
jgi:hypothetical protein